MLQVTAIRPRRARVQLFTVALVLAVVTLCGCGGSSTSARVAARDEHAALVSYLHQVEPIRLAVNRLLDGADPILSDYHDGRISPAQAAQRMGVLERRFAAYTLLPIRLTWPRSSPLQRSCAP